MRIDSSGSNLAASYRANAPVSVARKALDADRLAGEQAVRLIDASGPAAASSPATASAQQRVAGTASVDGRGTLVNTRA